MKLRDEHQTGGGDPGGDAGLEVERRDFLRLMGASLAAAGAGACTRQPDEAIVPYGSAPEDIVPGVPLHFATAMPWSGGALGLLVESHMGRPTKVEGNPEHPSSRGSTDTFAQAAVLGLYDPDRTQVVQKAGRISTWGEFLSAVTPAIDGQQASGGAGLRILTPSVTSPTLAARLEALLERFPRARWHQWEPLNRDRERYGAELAFGRDVSLRTRLDRARVVLSLDDDFLSGPGGVRASLDYATARRARAEGSAPGAGAMARLYVAESGLSITGAKADHRLPLAPSGVVAFAGAVAAALGLSVRHADLPAEALSFAKAVAEDLAAQHGEALVLVGREQPPEVHALAHAINRRLDAVGVTVTYGEPVEARSSDQGSSIRQLVDDMRAGSVELLVVLGGNPVYDAPVDFEGALESVELCVHLGLYEDETSALSHWHVPEAHFLESWGDARAFDGSVSIIQPLIAPLYGGKTAIDVVSVLLGESTVKAYDAVRDHWRAELAAGDDFERLWRRALHDGWIDGTARAPVSVSAGDGTRDVSKVVSATVDGEGFEWMFRADPATYDGRFANSGWLQECPRPLTKITWDNAALMSPATAAALGVESGDYLGLPAGPTSTRPEDRQDRPLAAAVWVTAAHADGCVTLPLGYGRARAGGVGSRVGFDAYAVLRGLVLGDPLHAPVIGKTEGKHAFARTQDHHSMEGRDLIRVRTPGHLEDHGHHHEHVSIYPDHAATSATNESRSWGMVIDLNACTGCNACVVACQSENNIPVVGKEEVAKGRELHWIRIDRYYEEGPIGPTTRFQPVPCMHCENAPCEVVCPVGATTHSPEGLNEMTYNRCVGTRYCANNCPYKVRRFNFFKYSDGNTESLKLGRNPDVTVRSRGVMEKCTYCVQRINQARITAGKENRPIADGEVRTACQGVCPAQAITFGDINDPASEVARLRAEPHHYGILEELNTRPRTTYLADVDNVNPALAHLTPATPGQGQHGEGEHGEASHGAGPEGGHGGEHGEAHG